MIFEAGISIDDTPVTDQGRGPISAGRDERSVIVELANGTRKKYIKKIARTYTVSWDNLASSSDHTIDGYAGRDWLFDNFSQEGETHTVEFRHKSGDSEIITAFVTDYSEELKMRREEDFFWTVNITFEEQ